MATLNIKNFPDALYKKLQARAKRQRRSVTQEVTHILAQAVAPRRRLSIRELQGLGKEYWADRNATAHVEIERRSWD